MIWLFARRLLLIQSNRIGRCGVINGPDRASLQTDKHYNEREKGDTYKIICLHLVWRCEGRLVLCDEIVTAVERGSVAVSDLVITAAQQVFLRVKRESLKVRSMSALLVMMAA